MDTRTTGVYIEAFECQACYAIATMEQYRTNHDRCPGCGAIWDNFQDLCADAEEA